MPGRARPALHFYRPNRPPAKPGRWSTELLVPNPVEAINVTPAYIFRKVGDQENGRPTILHDEIDTVFGPKARENEEIRGLLNAGHRRGAVAGRCIVRGKTVETEEISAYCAVALAGLGWLPDTILTRSVIIRMRRRAPGETVTPFRRRVHSSEGHALRDQLAIWAAQVADTMATARPEMPPGIEDRNADIWEPLLAIADAVGGDWPKRARDAAIELVGAAKKVEPSLGIRLLADLKIVFDTRGQDKLTTSVILNDLVALPESPWGDLKGKQITDRALATRLRQYGIVSRDVFVAGKGLKGYCREDLHDAWLRYLPSSPPQKRDERDEGDDFSELTGFHGTGIAVIADSTRDVPPERDGNASTKSSDLAHIALIADVRGDGEEKVNEAPSDNPGDMECLRRDPARRCDHCGSQLGSMNPYDWPGRPDGIWLHPSCEGLWFDSVGRGGCNDLRLEQHPSPAPQTGARPSDDCLDDLSINQETDEMSSKQFIDPTSGNEITKEQWLAIRKEAGLQIDPKTAEVDWCFAEVLDPYSVEDHVEESCVGRAYFARSPGSDPAGLEALGWPGGD
jgi:Protein of unknown function (DUF3631)